MKLSENLRTQIWYRKSGTFHKSGRCYSGLTDLYRSRLPLHMHCSKALQPIRHPAVTHKNEKHDTTRDYNPDKTRAQGEGHTYTQTHTHTETHAHMAVSQIARNKKCAPHGLPLRGRHGNVRVGDWDRASGGDECGQLRQGDQSRHALRCGLKPRNCPQRRQYNVHARNGRKC